MAETSIRTIIKCMLGLFRLTILVCLLASAPARAQQGADPFCAKAPLEMLAALDGEWTLRQGAGFAAAAGMIIPLPPHPPKPVIFEFDEWFARLTAEDGNMVMFPTDEEQIAATIVYLTEAEAERLLDIGEGCDWYALPIMLGTNSYSLDRAEGRPESVRFVLVNYNMEAGDPHLSSICVAMPVEALGSKDDSRVIVGLDPPRSNAPAALPERMVAAVPVRDGEGCDPDHVPFRLKSGEGQMVMNLLVKFQSPNSGTGIVIFEGQMNGHKFGAKAPVQLTR